MKRIKFQDWNYKVVLENETLCKIEVSVRVRHKDYMHVLTTEVLDFKKEPYSITGIFALSDDLKSKVDLHDFALMQTSVADHFIEPTFIRENGVKKLTLITETYY